MNARTIPEYVPDPGRFSLPGLVLTRPSLGGFRGFHDPFAMQYQRTVVWIIADGVDHLAGKDR